MEGFEVVIGIQHYAWENFMNSSIPVVVGFWHHKCPFCKIMLPIFDQMPSKLGDIAKFIKLNILETKENRVLAIDQGVMGTPTFKVYCNGRGVGDIVGVKELEAFATSLKQLIDEAEKCIQSSTSVV